MNRGPERLGHTAVDPKRIMLFRDPPWVLRMTIAGDRSYLNVQVRRAAPLSDPGHYISILDSDGDEICMIHNADDLNKKSREVLEQELDRRYLTSTIQQIHSVRNEYGTLYFDVHTNRGRREFVIQNLHENARWLSRTRLFLMDVDGNRFEIPDTSSLDKRSNRFLALIPD